MSGRQRSWRWTGAAGTAVAVAVAVAALLAVPVAVSGDPAGEATGDHTRAATLGDGALAAPRTVAVDAAGRIFVADTEHHQIRRIDPSGEVVAIAGTGRSGYSGDGGQATEARLRMPHGIAVDGAGNVYVADSPNHRIRRIDPAGIITTVAGTGRSGFGGDGGPAVEARLNRPRNVEVDHLGHLIIADTENHRVRRVDAHGTITTIAGTGRRGSSGDGGPATEARFNDPRDIAVTPAGDLLVADTHAHQVRRVDAAGIVTTVAGSGTSGSGGDGGPATSASLKEPRGVAVDAHGNIFIADAGNDRVRWVDVHGTIRTLAPQLRLREPRGLNTDGHGRVHVADTGGHRIVILTAAG